MKEEEDWGRVESDLMVGAGALGLGLGFLVEGLKSNPALGQQWTVINNTVSLYICPIYYSIFYNI